MSRPPDGVAEESIDTGDDEGWPDEPDVPGSPPPDPLPVDVLPSSLRDWARSVAASCQVPPDLPISLALAVVSATLAGRVLVEVDDAWTEEWVAIYTVVILPSASRKSAAYAHMVRPLSEWEINAAASEPGRLWRAAEAQATMMRERATALRKAWARGGKSAPTDGQVRAGREDAEEAERAVPPRPRLLVQDATPEALVRVMVEAGGRAALFAPEGDVLRILDGRYSSSGDARLGLVKQAWSGEPYRVDRITRGGEWIRRPALTLALTIQPGVLESLVQRDTMRAEGFLGRMLFARPPHGLGKRLTGRDVPALDQGAEERYHEAIGRLMEIESAGEDHDATPLPHRLRLTRDARDVLYAFQAELEAELGDGGRLAVVRDAAGKAHGQAVRLAAILELAERAGDGRPLMDEPISARTMRSAIQLTRAYMTHALAVLADDLGMDREQQHLRYVLDRAVGVVDRSPELPDGATERELWRACDQHSAIYCMDDLRALTGDLVLRGCLRFDPRPSRGGQRPSPRLRVHPRLHRARRVRSLSKEDEQRTSGPSGPVQPGPSNTPEFPSAGSRIDGAANHDPLKTPHTRGDRRDVDMAEDDPEAPLDIPHRVSA